ncbi:Pescadillo N-terminus-domain-containing protein [Catenaria anguillulae PL171]|uniref:Pescadillo homolog n=1 Tax=Catenaria anguillulae PL171 TaxID=765915 RepID=A0A1Y2HL75_9FUNG|nr:Pescadillo N-terminus-domain-containing protein [Catenaria anguillulae PL171]
MAPIKKKGKTGAVTNYISRRQALKKLQISLKDFRRLCILKGIYPRDPPNKKKLNKGSSAPNTWYFRRDVQYLLHEPLLQKFRDWKIFARKMAKAMGKRNFSAAEALDENRPEFSLDHIIRERYPTFNEALRDLDDALSMIFLFASMRSTKAVKNDLLESVYRKSIEFTQYVMQTRSLRKTFISIKGIYYQAEIKGQDITWVTPHQFSQQPPSDVDFKVMGTFLQLYDTLLGFILYKLYADAGLKYPPALNEDLDKDGAGVAALTLQSTQESSTATQVQPASAAVSQKLTSAEKKRMQSLKSKIASLSKQGDDSTPDAAAPTPVDQDGDEEMADDFEAAGDANQDTSDINSRPLVTYSMLSQNAGAHQSLFTNLVFYLSREVPRSAVEFLVRSFGGQVGWDIVAGAGSPIKEDDPRITHHIVDRPSLPLSLAALPKRTFVQPQWVFDCVNAGKLLLVSGTKHGEGYGPGQSLPPHLSPFEAKSEHSYDPTAAYNQDQEEDLALADSDAEDEDDADDVEDEEGAGSDSDAEDEAEEAALAEKAAKLRRKKQAQEEADKLEMSQILMSKRNKHLFQKLQNAKSDQKAETDRLKRKKADLQQGGGSKNKKQKRA